MVLSHAYGVPPSAEQGARVLNAALDLGYDHFDTATLYGGGRNETLIGEAIGHRRDEYLLASKCGMGMVEGKRVIDGRPETLRAQVDASLTRLKTDRIDLYYLHRWDKSVPIEESVGELGRMVEAGKVLGIGLSEVSAATLRKAHAVHPIAAVQNEYSLWSRNVELGVLDATAELGVALVAFSPVARGLLAGGVASFETLVQGDIRRSMPRFQPDNLAHNLALFGQLRAEADRLGVTPAQLCLQWLYSRGTHVVAIPGTTALDHLTENLAAPTIPLDPADAARLDAIFAPGNVAGARYASATQAEIDTEEFAAA
ncbi:aldo/keto reductase [Sphingomonas turrisvirgatae]|uniref:Aldo/keto reductase n=2 Tax=Sphingomonas turrisvirgatae TaxID=1888892 RepID=A0A1E3LVH8_9SPHN|nr:aldo/keto reductase [Sphingomonas turrisvirgatae]